jgi:hypothetical protein
LGIAVGVAKGVLVCGILMSGAQVFMKPTEPFFTTSRLWPYLQPVTNPALAWMPEGLQRARTATAVSDPRSGPDRPGGAPPSAVDLDAVDWRQIQDILANTPEAISQVWRNKLQSLGGAEALSPEDLKSFISDHPGLSFSKAPLPPGQKPAVAPAGAAPTWPQPAAE